jgi:hypothetical protein
MPEAVTILDPGMLIDGRKQNVVSIYHITGGGRVVIEYSGYAVADPDRGMRFTFSSSEDNKLVAILPDNHVAIMDQAGFDRLDIASLRAGGKCELQLKSAGQEINSLEDLDRIISNN